MAGGFHSTSPLYHRVAFVASVTSKLPSALKKVEMSANEFRDKAENDYFGFFRAETSAEIS